MTIPASMPVRAAYIGDGVTVNFPVPFVYFENQDGTKQIKVMLADSNGLNEVEQIENVDFTITTGGVNGTLTMNIAPASGYKLTIVYNIPIEQLTDYREFGRLPSESIETAFDKVTALLKQQQEILDRCVKIGISSISDPDTLVAEVERIYASIDNVDAVADDLSNIDAVNANKTNIDTVATNISDVNALADDVVNINTVAGAISNVNTVATNISDVNALADDLSNINAVANDLPNIDAVKNNATNINAVAGNATNINTVAGIASDVEAVAGIASDVTAVNANKTNINAVNTNKTNIDTVATNMANVNAVAGNATNINAVNANKTNIDTVATNISDVNAVGGNIAKVTAVADDLTNIDAVKNNATNINAVAGNATNINTVAGKMDKVENVSDNMTDVRTVAGNTANIVSVATHTNTITAVNNNKYNINAVAANETNINAVATNMANVNAVAGNATNINAVNANKTNIDTVATNISDVNAVGGNIAKVAAVADDLTNIDAVVADLANIDAASTYADNAKKWAIGEPSEPSGGSAKYWAGQAAQGQIQSDWAQSDNTKKDFIKNKPTIPTVNNSEIVFTQGGVNKGSFRLNQATGATIALDDGGSSYSAGTGIDITNDTISVDTATMATKTFVNTGLALKQDTLESGTNIKTVNNQSLLGQGNIEISSGSSYSAGTGIVIANDTISVDGMPTSDADVETIEEVTVEYLLSQISGYDATKTQSLKNVNGTLSWVTEV